ncbi:MAG TPA: HlyD family type I secretion periplasmic adaptor subunit [Azospirillaceae bacterium]|nr:HlyD family type I secretion periplasmic adaptor subunit [Azospirillaceae bacterium]
MSGRSLAIRRQARPSEVSRTIDEFQSDASEIGTEPDPPLARATLYVMGALLLAALIWASFATLDRIVSARGKIVTVAPTVVVQPFETATIRSIDVKVGDTVPAGTALATLDPTFAAADADELTARLQGLEAEIARIEAERDGRGFVPATGSHGQLQQALWRDRQAQLAANLANYDQRLGSLQAVISSREQERDQLRARLSVLKQMEDMRRKLEANQTGSRLNVLLAQDTRLEVERLLQVSTGALEGARHELAALKSEREVFRQNWNNQLAEMLVAKRGERDALHEQLAKAKRRQDLIDLRTPVDAVVLEIAPRSVGSVVTPAEPLFKLVPTEATLEVEAGVEARQLGHIAVGDRVQVKFDAFPYQEHGMAEGRVATISGDSFTSAENKDGSPATPVYKVRVLLTATALRNAPAAFRLVPGMPLTAEIKVGKRSVMSYLLRPVLRSVNESMREP